MPLRARPPDPGPRHSPDWYNQAGKWDVLLPGDRLLVPCARGPAQWRPETNPPRLEVHEPDGVHVLADEGPRAQRHHLFVPYERLPSA